MKFNSYEIDDLLFNRQLSLYQRIDDLIKKHFNELDSDRLAAYSADSEPVIPAKVSHLI